jgi:hypothetical protein
MCNYFLDAYNFNDVEVVFMQPRHSYGKVALICSVIMVSVFLVLCLYRRYAKRKMREEINVKIEEAVNQYMALSNKDIEARDRAEKSQEVGLTEVNKWGN